MLYKIEFLRNKFEKIHMNQTRLDIEKSGLNLSFLEKNDTLGLALEKINSNFREISNAGGGPMGKPGKPGRPGCPGIPGPPGKDGDSELEWLGRIAKTCDMSTEEEINNVTDTIFNKYTNRSLLLSNLQEITTNDISSLKRNNINEEYATTQRVPDDFHDYKMKIYNSDENGIGKHIHFLNSKAVSTNNKYFCHSGFSISLDWDGNNIETLKIKAHENSEIKNHTQNVEFHTDILKIKRNEYSQELNFEAGAKNLTDNNVNTRGTVRLVNLTEPQVYSLPDRTGYLGVWQDTEEHSEIWESHYTPTIAINHARYEVEGNQMLNVNRNGAHLVSLDDRSIVRFKRLNNFVLVDFHLGLNNNNNQYEFYLHNIQIKLDKDLLGCLTNGWLPCTIVEDESYVSDEMNNKFSMFKIDSTDFGSKTNNTFILSFKLNTFNKTYFSLTDNTFWLSGQAWATVQSPSCALISFDIEQGSSCPELNIEKE